MPHALMRRSVDDGKPHAYDNPFTISMRYACECANGEVIQLSTVLDTEMLDLSVGNNDERFIWLMRRMLRDMQIEIKQHTGAAS